MTPEFIPGTVADTGTTLLPDGEADKLALRSSEDEAIKLTPGESVVLYGEIKAKRSKRNRRMLVLEVYVQQRLT